MISKKKEMNDKEERNKNASFICDRKLKGENNKPQRHLLLLAIRAKDFFFGSKKLTRFDTENAKY